MSNLEFTKKQRDTLKELFNVGIGRAASNLSVMVGARVELTVPSLNVFSFHSLGVELEGIGLDDISAVSQPFSGPIAGTAMLVFPRASALKIVSLLVGEESDSAKQELKKSTTLIEVGNIFLNGIMGTIGNMMNVEIGYSIPTFKEGTLLEVVKDNSKPSSSVVFMVKANFKVERSIVEGDFVFLYDGSSFDKLFSALDRVERLA
ncbi:MAG: chemotaxis protein CheX [Deltaproteobacteria bacterium]|nr:chemotaxis protein CheX [Deltaproteobacteria bacterium]